MKKKGFWEKLLKSSDEDDDSFQHLNAVEKDMIKGVVELSETTVKEVMVPRIDAVFISLDKTLAEAIEILIECGHSRVPVYSETIDNVSGILYAKDILKYLVSNPAKLNEKKIDDIIRKPYFVPESKKLDSLLVEFKRKKVHIAVSVDEYGGVSGLVCMEDIIEEIVGEIQDEFDNEDDEIMKISDDVYICDARVNLEDLNEEIKTDIPVEEFETLGGWVFDLFGKIPVKFEKVTLEKLDIIIQEVDGHKINKIKLIKKAGQ